jgi:hypothetical protein
MKHHIENRVRCKPRIGRMTESCSFKLLKTARQITLPSSPAIAFITDILCNDFSTSRFREYQVGNYFLHHLIGYSQQFPLMLRTSLWRGQVNYFSELFGTRRT